MQVSILRFCEIEIDGSTLTRFGDYILACLFRYVSIAADRTADDVQACIVDIDSSAMQTGILDQSATVQCIVHAVGVDSASTTNLGNFGSSFFFYLQLCHGLTIHDGNAV